MKERNVSCARHRLGVITLAAALAYIGIAVVAPVLCLLIASMRSRDFLGGFAPGWSFDAWRDLANQSVLIILARSAGFALGTTALCAGIGIPLGIAIRSRSVVFRKRAAVLVLFPITVNSLLVAYNWQIILGNAGLINSVLLWLGWVHEPLPLVFNSAAVIMGMTCAYLPFFLLPTLLALERLDSGYIAASSALGASTLQTNIRVVLPLARNGIATGCLLVFLPCYSEFILPDLLGGGKTFLAGSLIQFWFYEGRNWPAGAAVTLAVVVTMAILAIPVYRQVRSLFSDADEN